MLGEKMKVLKDTIAFLEREHKGHVSSVNEMVERLRELDKKLGAPKPEIVTYNVAWSAGRLFPLETFARDTAMKFGLDITIIRHIKHWTWHKIYAELKGPEATIKSYIQAVDRYCKRQGW